jgi:hypothetical protein
MGNSNQKPPPSSPPASPFSMQSVHGYVSYEDPMCLVVAAATSRDNYKDNGMENNRYIPDSKF